MIVAITGSSGRIGQELVDELGVDHELRLIDRRQAANRSVVRANLGVRPNWFSRKLARARLPRWERRLRGADTLIHLAADPNPNASWDRVERDNVAASCNVFDAAARQGVARVIFASSLHAIGDIESTLFQRYPSPDGPNFASDVPLRPTTPYGASKVFGELVGRMLVESGKLRTFIAARVGVFDPKPSNNPSMRMYWLSPRDLRSFFDRCVNVDLTGFHIVYALSAQPNPCDLTDTCRLLAWEPRESG